jgi:PAS domain-containing protein
MQLPREDSVAKSIRAPDTGQVLELHTTSRDVTSRHQAEEQLRLVQSAVEQIDEIVAVIDARRGEIFHARYRPTPGGIQRIDGPSVTDRLASLEERTSEMEDFLTNMRAAFE